MYHLRCLTAFCPCLLLHLSLPPLFRSRCHIIATSVCFCHLRSIPTSHRHCHVTTFPTIHTSASIEPRSSPIQLEPAPPRSLAILVGQPRVCICGFVLYLFWRSLFLKLLRENGEFRRQLRVSLEPRWPSNFDIARCCSFQSCTSQIVAMTFTSHTEERNG